MKLFLLQVLFCYMSTVIVDLSNCSPILTQKLVSVNQIILQHKPKYEVAGSYDHEKKIGYRYVRLSNTKFSPEKYTFAEISTNLFELSFGNLKLHLHNLYVNDPSWITWQGIFDNNLQFWQDSNRNKFLIYVEKNEQIFMMKDLICDEKGSFSAKILFNNGMELIGKWKNYSMLAEYYLPCLKSLLASNVILSKYVKTEEKNKEQ